MRFNLQLSIPLLFFIFLVGCGGRVAATVVMVMQHHLRVKSEDVETTPVEGASDAEGTPRR